MAPRRPLSVPRRPKMAPKVAQERPKMVPRRPPRAPRAPKDLSETPLASHLGHIALQASPKDPKVSPKWHPEWPQRLQNDGKFLPAFPLTCCKRVPPMSCHTDGGTPFVPSPTFRSARRPLPLRHKNNAKTIGFSASVASCAPTIIHNGLSKKAGGGGDLP